MNSLPLCSYQDASRRLTFQGRLSCLFKSQSGGAALFAGIGGAKIAKSEVIGGISPVSSALSKTIIGLPHRYMTRFSGFFIRFPCNPSVRLFPVSRIHCWAGSRRGDTAALKSAFRPPTASCGKGNHGPNAGTCRAVNPHWLLIQSMV